MAAELAPEGIVSESKFLRLDSLHELVKALIIESRPAEGSDLQQLLLEDFQKELILNKSA